ncbi:N-6 DNA methylase [Bizionia saleffrena]|uniref:site-specific DNA-methyltransferase (adenine-specific) n=1 Tax=Bizionia saleffrena TaxID=291189 RepID=A0A8H2LH95_9FLAO|nr:TaqI-like C-terminal specificity domain-containing protein [Bizionia saleffrena]TYB80339.1 N-6 DNA methylase [Bizionia saleffrena]
MSLFQTSVLKQHLSLQDQDVIAKAYKKYTKYFLNPTIQENIRGSKEEEYQGIFLTELFVNILGYTLKPNADFNLVAEYKNQNNARKADGAILNNDVAIGVIELKGTNTKDLESIRKQAFDYKANQKGCVYVITSNFEKLRFYINDATEFEEFNLFELSPERFALFYLCLQKDNVLNNNPLKIKEASVVVEEQITKQFYKDYSLFKRELFRDLVKRNVKRIKTEALSRANQSQLTEVENEDEKAEQLKLEKNVKLTLFKKSQKLIDRYLFIFFAEDRGLLPPNSTQQILDKWKDDVAFGDDRPLYILFKQYFNFLDQGRKGTTSRAEIYAYNGGLFKEDKVLDSLEIDNQLLYKHTKQLAAYDFESQVDVNILGHIFENSLNEIESVNAEIEGGDFDKQTSKRKKDGVFYTPKYITKYIVENTIGKLCDEKKIELDFKEEEYFKGRKNRNKATITNLVVILDTYRDWLLQLTICDPACGSGAFLNQALDFLIKEHTYIDELKTKVLGGGLQFPDIENTILENNIYGVDLNEESVEIAKLSLWLRTAQPRRKLNDLSSNIKCGNSLIDSKAVAGDKAFNWEEQFPKVFEKGGFDVIIGNPPYVFTRGNTHFELMNEYIWKRYVYNSGKINLYSVFMELSMNCLLKENGYLGFITPETFIRTSTYQDIRNFLIESKLINEVHIYGMGVFENVTAETVTLIVQNKYVNNNKVYFYKYDDLENKSVFQEEQFSFRETPQNRFLYGSDSGEKQIFDKMKLNSNFVLGDVIDVRNGIATKSGKNSFISDNKVNDDYKKLLESPDLSRYGFIWPNKYINYNPEVLHRPRKEETFLADKILLQRVSSRLICSLDVDSFYTFNSINNLVVKDDNVTLNYILGILNSKLMDFFYRKNYSLDAGFTITVTKANLDSLPIVIIDSKLFEDSVSNIVESNRGKNKLNLKFQKYLQGKFSLEKLSKKLQNWYELEFGDFIKELNKAIKANNKLRIKEDLQEVTELTKKDEFEWLDLFEENKQKAQALQTQINQTDKEIDQMVYELYGLTEDEIVIVENS